MINGLGVRSSLPYLGTYKFMRTIDINTTQNVTIKYDLAGLRDRFFAFFIDLIVNIGGCIILMLLLLAISGGDGGEYLIFFILLVSAFYTLVSEMLMHGQTLGKKALGIKVVKINGAQPVANEYILRWLTRLVDIWTTAGAIGAIMVYSSDRGQRVGDMLSNTTVVRIRPNLALKLTDILNIDSRADYEPKYPGVRQFSEQEMLLVKGTIDRYRKYPNPAHREALEMLVQRLIDVLELDKKERPKDKMGFLRDVIKDYIVLTR